MNWEGYEVEGQMDISEFLDDKGENMNESAEKLYTNYSTMLSDLEQYRAIGTVEDIRKVLSFLGDENKRSIIDDLKLLNEYKATGLTPELIEAMQGHNIAMINDLEEYQEIGTVEELKEIRAKAIDEFVKEICKKYTEEESKGNCRQYCVNIKQDIADMAEQMN